MIYKNIKVSLLLEQNSLFKNFKLFQLSTIDALFFNINFSNISSNHS
jgi:hypothetical protein